MSTKSVLAVKESNPCESHRHMIERVFNSSDMLDEAPVANVLNLAELMDRCNTLEAGMLAFIRGLSPKTLDTCDATVARAMLRLATDSNVPIIVASMFSRICKKIRNIVNKHNKNNLEWGSMLPTVEKQVRDYCQDLHVFLEYTSFVTIGRMRISRRANRMLVCCLMVCHRKKLHFDARRMVGFEFLRLL
jgi:hypothetical protein